MVSWMRSEGCLRGRRQAALHGQRVDAACEGAERVPYPYGYVRDSTACNIDRPTPTPTSVPSTRPREVAGEVSRLDQRVASGEMTPCKSPYGVQDMTGNVDEWVVNEKHFGPASADGSERPVHFRPQRGILGTRAQPLPGDHDLPQRVRFATTKSGFAAARIPREQVRHSSPSLGALRLGFRPWSPRRTGYLSSKSSSERDPGCPGL